MFSQVPQSTLLRDRKTCKIFINFSCVRKEPANGEPGKNYNPSKAGFQGKIIKLSILLKSERLTQSSLPFSDPVWRYLVLFYRQPTANSTAAGKLGWIRMQSNTVGLFSYFFNNHFVGWALYVLVNLWTTLKLVWFCRYWELHVPHLHLHRIAYKLKKGEWHIATDTELKHTTNTHHEFISCIPS